MPRGPATAEQALVVMGSIAELTSVNIDGQEQALMIRGYEVNKPILLYLSGGPGQSSLPWPRVLFNDLSREFIIVGWDQRGTGKSYAALDPTETLTLNQRYFVFGSQIFYLGAKTYPHP